MMATANQNAAISLVIDKGATAFEEVGRMNAVVVLPTRAHLFAYVATITECRLRISKKAQGREKMLKQLAACGLHLVAWEWENEYSAAGIARRG